MQNCTIKKFASCYGHYISDGPGQLKTCSLEEMERERRNLGKVLGSNTGQHRASNFPQQLLNRKT